MSKQNWGRTREPPRPAKIRIEDLVDDVHDEKPKFTPFFRQSKQKPLSQIVNDRIKKFDKIEAERERKYKISEKEKFMDYIEKIKEREERMECGECEEEEYDYEMEYGINPIEVEEEDMFDDEFESSRYNLEKYIQKYFDDKTVEEKDITKPRVYEKYSVKSDSEEEEAEEHCEYIDIEGEDYPMSFEEDIPDGSINLGMPDEYFHLRPPPKKAPPPILLFSSEHCEFDQYY